MVGDFFLGGVDALQAEPNNFDSACWQAGDLARDDIYILAGTLNPTLIVNNFQLLQIKIQNTIEACALKVMINFIDSRMSNLDYTLGIISNIISETASGFQVEQSFVSTVGSASLSNDNVSKQGPDISVYQSLNYLWVTYQNDVIGNKGNEDYYLLGFYFMKLIAGFLNFKSPNVSADLAAD